MCICDGDNKFWLALLNIVCVSPKGGKSTKTGTGSQIFINFAFGKGEVERKG